ncbi:MAG: hypothetical protein J5640_01255 [Bacteroidales bacterium]|nr:hypothetical protein [Bacteroidales bacterium]
MAVSYERAIWEGASLEEANNALRGKAECYKQLGRYAEASATLGRVRMFALLPEERQEVLYQQELCHFLAGDFAQSATFVGEVEPASKDILLLHALALAYAGKFDESEIFAARFISWDGESPHLQALLDLYAGHPVPRDHTTALVLSFLPPAGHIYNGRPAEGLLSAGLNAVSVAFTAASLLSGYWVTGIVGGSIALNYTLMGSIERNAALVEAQHRDSVLEFGDRVREFLAQTLKPL